MATGPRVKVAIVEKRFAGLPAPLFGDLHLEIAPGAVVALLGPSGVGKSSLLRMIAGVDTDFSGSISIDGKPAAEAPPPGFVFQDSRLLPWLNAIDNILAVAPQIARSEALSWLERVGLGDSATSLPHELSGGMQRRVALARALAVNPRLLLLDEPFVSLDRQLVRDLHRLFADIAAAEAATVILVSHLAEDAARLADRAVTLSGRPAHIVSDQPLDTPRDQRTPNDLLRLTEALEVEADEAADDR